MRYPQGYHCELRRPRSGSGTMREGSSGRVTARLPRTIYRGRCVPPLPSWQRKKKNKTQKPRNPQTPTNLPKAISSMPWNPSPLGTSLPALTCPHSSRPASASPPGPQRGWCRFRLPVPSAPRCFLSKCFPVPTSPAQLSAVSEHGPRITSSS